MCLNVSLWIGHALGQVGTPEFGGGSVRNCEQQKLGDLTYGQLGPISWPFHVATGARNVTLLKEWHRNSAIVNQCPRLRGDAIIMTKPP